MGQMLTQRPVEGSAISPVEQLMAGRQVRVGGSAKSPPVHASEQSLVLGSAK